LQNKIPNRPKYGKLDNHLRFSGQISNSPLFDNNENLFSEISPKLNVRSFNFDIGFRNLK